MNLGHQPAIRRDAAATFNLLNNFPYILSPKFQIPFP
jgi:hypothetical protein